MKRFFSFILSLGLLASPFVHSESITIPTEFTVSQRWLSWTSDFDIETREYKLGYVHRKFLSLTVEYEFYNVYEQLEAEAKLRWFSWGATFDVTDAFKRKLGTVEERIFTFFPTFDIISPDHQILATAKLNFWGTTYTLKDPVTHQEFAKLSRPFFRLKDDWTVNITNPMLYEMKQIDPRLFILVMVFQTDRDIWEAIEHEYHEISHDASLASKVSNKIAGKPNKAHLLKLELQQISRQLNDVSKEFENAASTESDIQFVEELVEAALESSECQATNYAESQLAGLKVIVPLLHSDTLTTGQKSALHKMLMHHINP